MPLAPLNHSLGTPFIELQSIDSTNNYALAQIHANLGQAGTCYFAHQQTAGKGQQGKSWSSEKGANIILSIVADPYFLQPFQQFQLSACVAVATHRFLSNHISDNLKIKWPNDLYWKDQKLGGILIENVIGGITGSGSRMSRETGISNNKEMRSNWKWAVIGIGININQEKFPGHLKNPVSLKQITGQNFNTVQLAKELCKTIDHHYKKLLNDGMSSNWEAYNKCLYKKNEIIAFKKDNRRFEAVVKSVNETGQLIIHHSIEEKIDFGAVEWIIT